mgnify:CR=1 FL=1
MLKKPTNKGLKKLPTEVRNKMGFMKKGGMVEKYSGGGKIKARGAGAATKGFFFKAD